MGYGVLRQKSTSWRDPEWNREGPKRLNVVYTPQEGADSVPNGSARLFGTLALAENASNDETDICGAFAQTAHEVGEPFTAEWNIDADPQTLADQ